MKLSIVAMASLFVLFSCKHNDDNANVEGNYLPLKVGNSWQFEHSTKKEVVGTKEINKKKYFTVVFDNDTTYYRIDNNMVYTLSKDRDESLMFKLSAKVNETWNSGLWVVKLTSKTDTVTINNTKIINCYQFYFDIPGAADDEHSVWLAPGIGFIQEQCGECIYPIRKLSHAVVDGKALNW